MKLTPTQKLATLLLGQNVREWITDQRREGTSWRVISRNLYEQTNRQVDVSHEAVRAWADEPRGGAA